MQYRYSGFDKSGAKRNGLIEATSLSNAKSKLRDNAIMYTKIEEIEHKKESFKLSLSPQKSTFKPLELSNISTNIAIYLDAGISITNAIKLLSNQQPNNSKTKSFLESIFTFLNEGKNLYASLEAQTTYELPPFYLQSIKVSESGGMLSLVLKELGVFLKEQDKLEKQISNAMSYPMFIMVVSLGMVGFLISYVVPQITGIFATLHQELPFATRFVLGLSGFVTDNGVLLLIMVLGVVFGLRYAYKTQYDLRLRIDTMLHKLPFVGNLIETSELSRFAYISSLLINSGVGFAQSIRLSSGILGNEAIKLLFTQASNKMVEGEKLSTLLSNAETKIDSSFVQAIAIAEETSQLYPILQNLAVLYKEKNSDKITKMLSLLEPMMMLVVGGFVGFIVIAMLLPIFSMNVG